MTLTPLNKRRLANFRANRRGWWSLWIFAVLLVVSLGAEFIANDKPLLIRYDGRFYFPIVRSYPETDFGGFLETEADYNDPAVQELIEYLDLDGAYRLERIIGNCAVYRKVRERRFGWKSQTIHRDADGVDIVRQELERLRTQVAPELRASLTGAAPLPSVGAIDRSGLSASKRSPVASPQRPISGRELARWYASPSGALACAARSWSAASHCR